MRFVLKGKPYRLTFRAESDDRGVVDTAMTIQLWSTLTGGVSKWWLVHQTRVRRYKHDPPNRVVARREALSKLLREMGWDAEERDIVWEVFFTCSPRSKSPYRPMRRKV